MPTKLLSIDFLAIALFGNRAPTDPFAWKVAAMTGDDQIGATTRSRNYMPRLAE
jgi:hypothetical protein